MSKQPLFNDKQRPEIERRMQAHTWGTQPVPATDQPITEPMIVGGNLTWEEQFVQAQQRAYTRAVEAYGLPPLQLPVHPDRFFGPNIARWGPHRWPNTVQPFNDEAHPWLVTTVPVTLRESQDFETAWHGWAHLAMWEGMGREPIHWLEQSRLLCFMVGAQIDGIPVSGLMVLDANLSRQGVDFDRGDLDLYLHPDLLDPRRVVAGGTLVRAPWPYVRKHTEAHDLGEFMHGLWTTPLPKGEHYARYRQTILQSVALTSSLDRAGQSPGV